MNSLWNRKFRFVSTFCFLAFAARDGFAFVQTMNLFFLFKSLVALAFAIAFLMQAKASSQASWPQSIVALLHSAFPFAFVSGGVSLINVSTLAILMIIAALVSSLALTDLWESIGVIPANRGVKTGGLYKIVRHPIYLGYVLAATSWTLYQFSWTNLSVAGLYFALTKIRIDLEEAHLSADPSYVSYRSTVPFRLLPGLY